MPTINRILQLAPTCCYLASNDASKQGLFQGAIPTASKNQATLIYIYYTILNKIYTIDPTYPGLQAPANYLYELEQKFVFKAAQIVDGGGGGQVTPITPATKPMRIEFNVSASSFIAAGQSTVQLPLSWAGWNVELDRGNVPQSTLNTEASYFNYDEDTRELTISPAGITGELIAIIPSV